MKNSFNSLHIINKRAKIYKQKQNEIAKLRANALYQLKHNALINWKENIDNIEMHYINDKKYYCFYYQNYSFHVPQTKVYEQIPTTKKRVLHNFESDTSLAKNEYLTEKESLKILHEKHNLNPNFYLPNDSPYQTYWPYLPM